MCYYTLSLGRITGTSTGMGASGSSCTHTAHTHTLQPKYKGQKAAANIRNDVIDRAKVAAALIIAIQQGQEEAAYARHTYIHRAGERR